MARKKRGGSKAKKGSGSKSRPAVLSLGRTASKRSAKARVGRDARRGTPRKASAKSRVRGRRY
jgi:hypothetical protein